MIKLTVAIITYNEEKNIGRCISSVQSIADEILVVDSFSTDKTEEICNEFGVRFIKNAFKGHIEQKNIALELSTHEHVLSLDADEALSPILLEEIKKIKENFEAEGYRFNRLTNYCGHWVRHCGWYPDTKLRLWDRSKGHWTGVNPHDKYELFAGDKNTGHLKGDILHYSYYSVEDHYKQVEYFTNIASKAFFENGKKAPLFKLVVNPVAKFIDHYLLKLGFLDGKAGYLISKISAYATYLKYKKLRNLYHQKPSK